jgi:hypothetical protein
MHLDGIRFYRNWTGSHNFREQIEALEIPQESVEKLIGDHDRRMKRILHFFSRYRWIKFTQRLLVGTDVRLPTSEEMVKTECSMFHK